MKAPSSNPTGLKEAGWKWALAALLLLVTAARGWLLFSTPLVPGMNGAYYLVQARSVLAHGTLGIPDLPLTFYLQALLARVIQIVSGGNPDTSILLAVKLADAILPSLIALPIFALVQRWAKTANTPTWIALAAAAATTLNAPALSMVGDFEKNSLGLVWLAALLLFLHRWLSEPTPPNAVGVIAFGALAAVTHIAVFGAAVMFSSLTVAIYLATHRGAAWRILWPLLIAAAAVGILAAGVVLWKFDPHRIQKLVAALTHPADYLTGSNFSTPGNATGGAPMGGPGGGPGAPPGSPGSGGHGFFRISTSLPFLLFGTAALAALAVCWRRRATLPAAETCVASACAIGTLILTGPWVQGDKSDRFQLIAIAPAILAGTFAILYWNHRWPRVTLCLAVLLGLLGPSLNSLRRGGQPIISETTVAELRSLAPLIENPEKTLISARHGMEWWIAWTLHTHIAQSTALRNADWQTFQAVFFLRAQHTQSPMMRGGPPPGADGPKFLPTSGRIPPPPRGMHPPDLGTPAHGHGANPMEGPEIPADAETVHQGKNVTLARILAPPVFVQEQSAAKK